MQDRPDLKSAKVPSLPPPRLNYEPLIPQLSAAHAAVGELRGLLSALPNPDILIAPFRKREAVASSAIEGTHATLEEVLEYEALESKTETEDAARRRKIEDILEIMNYETATNSALEELKTRPIGENLLKRTHHILLDSGRGADKDRGNFRRTQVRVGDYIPPVHTEIPALIANWEKYLNSDQESDPLIRIGVAHYQFEAIHPFLDGNGRIGRLIVPLFLCQVQMLQAPVLYISHHFEQHKREYQTLLHRVDTDQEWMLWLKFFLEAVEAQAKMTTSLATGIQELYTRLKTEVVTQIRSQHAITVLDAIFSRPIMTASSIRGVLRAKSKGTTYNLIDKFVKAKVLKELSGTRRENLYTFPELLGMLRM